MLTKKVILASAVGRSGLTSCLANLDLLSIPCVQVQDAVKYTLSTLGPVDILVNNAGVMYYTLMKNCHEDEWEQQIDVNCKVNHARNICVRAT